jgi:serine protease AprX
MKYIFLLMLFLSTVCYGQEEDAWVYFKDKPSSNTFLNAPILMLSQRSLDRRENQEILLDLKDVPIENSYVSDVSSIPGISVLAKSKWLNALHIRGSKSSIDGIVTMSCIDSIQFMDKSSNNIASKNFYDKLKYEKELKRSNLNYGVAENQVKMIKVDILHEQGYEGTGVHIAVMDAGFKGVESFSAFANLHDGQLSNGEVMGGYDYVNRSPDYYVSTGTTHGLSVLSTMAGFMDTQFIGSAPNALFYLFITEDNFSETPLEESLWVEAAERADSLGVDIINTSLGYTTFDNSSHNYSYSDMNGATAFISKGAEIACSRGMLLVNSAGNSGNNSWKYISAPADANSVLTIGAVNGNREIASFSSFGPSSDGRIKPEVLSQGQNVYVINGQGNIAISNGTSFSAPIIAGAAACLWEAFPTKKALEIKELIIQSSDLYHVPTAQRGYGIPNYQFIYDSLGNYNENKEFFKFYPNPTSGFLNLHVGNIKKPYIIKVFNLLGDVVYKEHFQSATVMIDLKFLKSGIYVLKFISNENVSSFKVIKE